MGWPIPTWSQKSISNPSFTKPAKTRPITSRPYIGDNQDITRYTLHRPPMQDRRGVVNSMGFGSPHVGGFNACMCDISVRPISYSIDPTVHRYLGNKADGQAVQPPP